MEAVHNLIIGPCRVLRTEEGRRRTLPPMDAAVTDFS